MKKAIDLKLALLLLKLGLMEATMEEVAAKINDQHRDVPSIP